jgi:ubiquinone/menaquinone biosynthesis C-methylase UbiE
LTILKSCTENQIDRIELKATDSSRRMLSLAKARSSCQNDQQISIDFLHIDDTLSTTMYDIITSSLVLPYVTNPSDMLDRWFRHIQSNGLLICSHWPHPSQVPFLTIIKRVNHFMFTGKAHDESELESDASFACWHEETTRQLFIKQGFTIQQWTTVHLPMLFANVADLLTFCRATAWFSDAARYADAEKETKRILHDDYHFDFQTSDQFHLPSNVIVVVASKA